MEDARIREFMCQGFVNWRGQSPCFKMLSGNFIMYLIRIILPREVQTLNLKGSIVIKVMIRLIFTRSPPPSFFFYLTECIFDFQFSLLLLLLPLLYPDHLTIFNFFIFSSTLSLRFSTTIAPFFLLALPYTHTRRTRSLKRSTTNRQLIIDAAPRSLSPNTLTLLSLHFTSILLCSKTRAAAQRFHSLKRLHRSPHLLDPLIPSLPTFIPVEPCSTLLSLFVVVGPLALDLGQSDSIPDTHRRYRFLSTCRLHDRLDLDFYPSHVQRLSRHVHEHLHVSSVGVQCLFKPR